MARPKITAGEEPVLLSVKIPAGLDRALLEFMVASGLKRSEAAREALTRGLAGDLVGSARERKARPHVANDGPASPEPKGPGKPGPAEKCRHPAPRVRNGFCFDCGENVKGSA